MADTAAHRQRYACTSHRYGLYGSGLLGRAKVLLVLLFDALHAQHNRR